MCNDSATAPRAYRHDPYAQTHLGEPLRVLVRAVGMQAKRTDCDCSSSDGLSEGCRTPTGVSEPSVRGVHPGDAELQCVALPSSGSGVDDPRDALSSGCAELASPLDCVRIFLGQLPFDWTAREVRQMLGVTVAVTPLRVERVLKRGGKTGCALVYLNRESAGDRQRVLSLAGRVLCDFDGLLLSNGSEAGGEALQRIARDASLRPPRGAKRVMTVELAKVVAGR